MSQILFLDSNENRAREITRRIDKVLCLSTSEAAIQAYELGAKFDVVCINVIDAPYFVEWLTTYMPAIKRIYLFGPEESADEDVILAHRILLSCIGYTTICMPYENLLTFVNV